MRKRLVVLAGIMLLLFMMVPAHIGVAVAADPPSITGIDPNPLIMPYADRIWITLKGSGFQQDSVVILENKTDGNIYTVSEAANGDRFTWISDEELQVKVGLRPIGPWSAQVENPGNVQSKGFEFNVYSEIIGALDDDLAELISELIDEDEKSDSHSYWNPTWNISPNQYKAWVATIAWSEGGKGGYMAHSQTTDPNVGQDKYPHSDIGAKFEFSRGIGQFQFDTMEPTWTTLEKLDREKALKRVLTWHYVNVKDEAILADFITPQSGGWCAVSSPEELWQRWPQITGRGWLEDSEGDTAADFVDLDWQSIGQKLDQNAGGSAAFKYGNQYPLEAYGPVQSHWTIDKDINGNPINTSSQVRITLNVQLPTWLITARDGNGNEEFKYWYTYIEDYLNPDYETETIDFEVWVYEDSSDADIEESRKLTYAFVRQCNGAYPENIKGVAGQTKTAGFALQSAALTPSPNTTTVTDIPDPDEYSCSQPGYIDFEGFPEGTNLTQHTFSGLEFSKTPQGDDGFPWLVGDFATGNYNGKYPYGGYTSQGTHWAWLGVSQGSGQITFTEGLASYFSVLVSNYYQVSLEAYDSNDNLLATAVGPEGGNYNTGHMTELKITRSVPDMG